MSGWAYPGQEEVLPEPPSKHVTICGDGECWDWGDSGISCPEDCEGVPGVTCEEGAYDCLGVCRAEDVPNVEDPMCNPAYDCREYGHDGGDCLRCETDADCDSEKHCDEYGCDAVCQIATCDPDTLICSWRNVSFGNGPNWPDTACGPDDAWTCSSGICKDLTCGNGTCDQIVDEDRQTCPEDCQDVIPCFDNEILGCDGQSCVPIDFVDDNICQAALDCAKWLNDFGACAPGTN